MYTKYTTITDGDLKSDVFYGDKPIWPFADWFQALHL